MLLLKAHTPCKADPIQTPGHGTTQTYGGAIFFTSVEGESQTRKNEYISYWFLKI